MPTAILGASLFRACTAMLCGLRGRGRWEEVTRARPGDPHCESCLEPQLHSSNVTFFWRFGSIYRLNG